MRLPWPAAFGAVPTPPLTPDDAELFGYSCAQWPEFPDSAPALKTLHELGFKLTVLSNVDNSSFEATRKLLERGFAFDAVYTAADIGSYKPSSANFEYAMSRDFDQWGTEPREILIVANSKLHDLEPCVCRRGIMTDPQRPQTRVQGRLDRPQGRTHRRVRPGGLRARLDVQQHG